MGERPSAVEALVTLPNPSFWGDKRVLVTGHTGFKGSWLSLWLVRLGARVTGYALTPNTDPSLFNLLDLGNRIESHIGDLADRDGLAALVADKRPEVIFHLAAQPLVRTSYFDPVGTFASNTLGTVHLLDAVRQTPTARSVVAVTTDKVYHNREWAHPYREDDRLGGYDPYSASKAAAEIVVASYRAAFLAAQDVRLASARAGNVIGGGDWSADRLIPDAVRAWLNNGSLNIRRPDASRPWQHVIEPIRAYMLLAERLWNDRDTAGAFNFGPETQDAADVRTVVTQARNAFGRGTVTYADHLSGPHEAGLLALDISKARHELGITPRWSLTEAIFRTIHWYRAYAEGADAWALCEADITAYEATA